jgi:uncharacterized protein with PhoU and TrkA domain
LSESDKAHWEKITRDLVTLKNTSELMIDIAYSALLLNSRYLAEVTINMEEHMDRLHIDFQKEALSRTEEETDPKELIGIIRMGNVTERIADAASEIAEVVLRGVEPHPVLGMMIQDAEETVERVVVGSDSPVVGKTLKEARVAEETGMWIFYIRRNDHWMRAKPSTRLEPGDLVVASGYSEGKEDFTQLITGNTK